MYHPKISLEYMNKIVTGDARKLSRYIQDNSVDLVLTDPPFGIGFDYKSTFKDDPEEYIQLIKWIVKEGERVAKPGAFIFVYVAQKRLKNIYKEFPENVRIFAACKNFVQFRPIPIQYSFDPVIFWQKEGASLIKPIAGIRDWHIGNTAYYVTQKPRPHQCPRPQNTIDYMVNNFCPKGGVVLDWFVGSGTTAIAAIKTNRSYIAFEIDPDTAQRARKRVNNTQPALVMAKPPDQLELNV